MPALRSSARVALPAGPILGGYASAARPGARTRLRPLRPGAHVRTDSPIGDVASGKVEMRPLLSFESVLVMSYTLKSVKSNEYLGNK